MQEWEAVVLIPFIDEVSLGREDARVGGGGAHPIYR